MRRYADTPSTKQVDVLLLRLDAMAQQPRVKQGELQDLSRRLAWAWEEHRRTVGLQALSLSDEITLRSKTR